MYLFLLLLLFIIFYCKCYFLCLCLQDQWSNQSTPPTPSAARFRFFWHCSACLSDDVSQNWRICIKVAILKHFCLFDCTYQCFMCRHKWSSRHTQWSASCGSGIFCYWTKLFLSLYSSWVGLEHNCACIDRVKLMLHCTI